MHVVYQYNIIGLSDYLVVKLFRPIIATVLWIKIFGGGGGAIYINGQGIIPCAAGALYLLRFLAFMATLFHVTIAISA